MNGQYLSFTPAEELLEPVRRQLKRLGVDDEGRDLRPIVESVNARSRTIIQLAEQVSVRLNPQRAKPDDKGQALRRKMGSQFEDNLARARAALEYIPPAEWNPDQILTTLKEVAESNKLKLGDVMQPVRVALTGSTVSEPVNELLFVVGRESSINTLKVTPQRWDSGTKAR
jgi:glutamyl-tRNA synthetase